MAPNAIYSVLFIFSCIFTKYLALIYVHLNKLTIAITGKNYYALHWHDSQLNSSYVSSRYRRPFQASPPPRHFSRAGRDQGRTPFRSGTLAYHWVKCVCRGRAWSIGLNLIRYSNPGLGHGHRTRVGSERSQRPCSCTIASCTFDPGSKL